MRPAEHFAAAAAAERIRSSRRELDILPDAPRRIERMVRMHATIFRLPSRGLALLACAPDRVAQLLCGHIVHLPAGCQCDAIAFARTGDADPAIAHVVCHARGLAIERIAEPATARRKEHQHVACCEHTACLRRQVLDGATEIAVFERNPAGLELVPDVRAAQHAHLRARARIAAIDPVGVGRFGAGRIGRFEDHLGDPDWGQRHRRRQSAAPAPGAASIRQLPAVEVDDRQLPFLAHHIGHAGRERGGLPGMAEAVRERAPGSAAAAMVGEERADTFAVRRHAEQIVAIGRDAPRGTDAVAKLSRGI